MGRVKELLRLVEMSVTALPFWLKNAQERGRQSRGVGSGGEEQAIVFVSSGGPNRRPQTGCLKGNVFSYTFLESGKLAIETFQGWFLVRPLFPAHRPPPPHHCVLTRPPLHVLLEREGR